MSGNGLEAMQINGDLSSESGWTAEDMLMTNQQKYGYKSTYDSNLSAYTVAIERDDSEDYRRREEEAEKMVCGVAGTELAGAERRLMRFVLLGPRDRVELCVQAQRGQGAVGR